MRKIDLARLDHYLHDRLAGISHEELAQSEEAHCQFIQEVDRVAKALLEETSQQGVDVEEALKELEGYDVTAPSRHFLERLHTHVLIPLQQAGEELSHILATAYGDSAEGVIKKEALKHSFQNLQQILRKMPKTSREQSEIERLGVQVCQGAKTYHSAPQPPLLKEVRQTVDAMQKRPPLSEAGVVLECLRRIERDRVAIWDSFKGHHDSKSN